MPKDFGRWLADQKPILESEPAPPAEPELPSDVTEDVRYPGKYKAKCCACGDWVEMLCSLEQHQENNYWCGRSPRCCP